MKRLLVLSFLLGGCASTPDGPSVLVLPGSGKSLDVFRADDAECRRYAGTQAPGGTQQRYDFAYQQCMYARGHQIPVARGSVPRQSGTTAAPSAPPAPSSPDR